MRVFSDDELRVIEENIRTWYDCPPATAMDLISELRWRRDEMNPNRVGYFRALPKPGLTRLELALLAGVLLGFVAGLILMLSIRWVG